MIDIMLDCGATVSCNAKRCVTGNPVLNKIPRLPYHGPPLVGANGQLLSASSIIHVPFANGTPKISLPTKFIVVDGLPYLCIVGLNILHRFDSWGIDNKLCRPQLNNSSLPVFTEPQSTVCNVNLITCYKTRLQPGETRTIKTVARGLGLDALRPLTSVQLLSEGVTDRETRTNVLVHPAF